MANVTSENLLDLIIDNTSRRVLASTAGVAPRSQPLVFTRGDLLKGTARVVQQSGVASPPLLRIAAIVRAIALTDGESAVYVTAIDIQPLDFPAGADPRAVFNFDVSGPDLDTALSAQPGVSMSAFLEVKISLRSLPDGDYMLQNEFIIREPCTIFKTALNPLP